MAVVSAEPSIRRRIARRLKAVSFTEDQAEAVTGVLRDARDAGLSTLATKADLVTTKYELRTEVAAMKFKILKWVLSAIGFQTIVIAGAIAALTRGRR